MKTFKKTFITLSIMAVLLWSQGCDDPSKDLPFKNGSVIEQQEEETAPATASDQTENTGSENGDINDLEAIVDFIYKVSPVDTFYLSSDAAEVKGHFYDSISDTIVNDWHLLKVCTNYPFTKGGWMPGYFNREREDIDKYESDDLSIWCEESDGKVELKVKVGPNEKNHDRGFLIQVEKIKDKRILCGEFYIIQRCKTYTESYPVKVKYKGRLYESMSYRNPKGEIEYESQELRDLQVELSQKDDLETIVFGDNTVCFYDADDIAVNTSLSSFVAKLDDIKVNKESQFGISEGLLRNDSRTGQPFALNDTSKPGFFAAYDYTDFEGYKVYYHMVSLSTYFDAWDLQSYNFLNMISSVSVAYNSTNTQACSVLTLWDSPNWNHGDPNRLKRRISFIATYYQPQVTCADFSTIFTYRGTWDNHAGSMSFFFGQYGNYMPNY